MIKEVHIKDIDGINDLVFEQERNIENGRMRSHYYYRGLPDASFRLLTSLDRNCADKARELEKLILENFIKYVCIEDPLIDETVWKAMVVGQHHGLPTRLLDWTRSVLVALHFADTEDNLDKFEKRDCAVWRMDVRELNELLPPKYKNTLVRKHTSIFSLKDLAEITNSLDEYDQDMNKSAMVTIEPPSIGQRIVNQYSFFSIVPDGISDVEDYLDKNTNNTVKYVIDKSLRWDLRDILDQLNMSERMIYPGKDGICKWIARHYYVKKQ